MLEWLPPVCETLTEFPDPSLIWTRLWLFEISRKQLTGCQIFLCCFVSNNNSNNIQKYLVQWLNCLPLQLEAPESIWAELHISNQLSACGLGSSGTLTQCGRSKRSSWLLALNQLSSSPYGHLRSKPLIGRSHPVSPSASVIQVKK